MKKPVLVLGAGGHAKILIDIIGLSEEYYLEAVIGREDEPLDTILGYTVKKGDKHLKEYLAKGVSSLAIGIGGYSDNHKRTEIFIQCRELGFEIINLIHPSAIVSESARLGVGVVIFAGAVINPEVIIGNNVIIATGSTIDHETVIEDNVLVSAGVTVGARDTVKEGSLLALGAKVISRVTIGRNALVAAGAVVVNNVPDNAAVYGIPAKLKA
jgi:sugar O-acyltransferase (sialic acid O-acetyltransferase NeuD family)